MNNNLKKIRLAMGLNQKDFSEKLGIKQSYYSTLENGEKAVSPKVLDKIWELGISYEWYYEGTGEMFKHVFDNIIIKEEHISNSNKQRYKNYVSQMESNKNDIIENNKDFLFKYYGESNIQPFNLEYIQIKYYNQFNLKKLKVITDSKISIYESKYNSRMTLAKMLSFFGGPDFMLEKFPIEEPFPKEMREIDKDFKEETQVLKDIKLKKIIYILHLDNLIEHEDYLLEKVINYIGMYQDMIRDHIKVDLLQELKKKYPDIDILKTVYNFDSEE